MFTRPLTVDIGKTTAWAMWQHKAPIKPITGYFCQPSGARLTKEEFLLAMGARFSPVVSYAMGLLCDGVVIEGVEFWPDSARSDVSARRQDLIALAYLAGVYYQIVVHTGLPCMFLTARQWKGQLTKIACQHKITRIIGCGFPNEHIYDAVGIGLSMTDLWKR